MTSDVHQDHVADTQRGKWSSRLLLACAVVLVIAIANHQWVAAGILGAVVFCIGWVKMNNHVNYTKPHVWHRRVRR